jgi:hypothetical protein
VAQARIHQLEQQLADKNSETNRISALYFAAQEKPHASTSTTAFVLAKQQPTTAVLQGQQGLQSGNTIRIRNLLLSLLT